MEPAFLKHTLAILVVYGKRASKAPAFPYFKELTSRGLNLLVFDNGPVFEKPEGSNIHYFASTENKGVSGAYNHGAELAQSLGLSWLWFTDDDSIFPTGSEDLYQKAIDMHTDEDLFVPRIYSSQQLLSPFQYLRGRAKRVDNVPEGKCDLKFYRPINTGMLITLKAFEEAGEYDPSLPLDFSDIEFTDRLSKTREHMIVTETKIEHGFSGDDKSNIESDARRFEIFLKAASYYAVKSGHQKALRQVRLRRALSLCLKHKTFRFLAILRQFKFEA